MSSHTVEFPASESEAQSFLTDSEDRRSSSLHGTRTIVARTKGRQHGSVIRVFSPGDLGSLLKPFVFLDYFHLPADSNARFAMHPHSGLATTTILLDGAVRYEDTTGASGVMSAGSVEWMNAGGGVWHDGVPEGSTPVRGYQLWTALPRDIELGKPESQYLSSGELPTTGPVRVILGRYDSVESPVSAPPGINYLHVRLRAGTRWRYVPPGGHTVAWLSVQSGALRFADQTISDELAAFSESEDVLDFVAEADTEFVFGSAVPHPDELVLGYYSVHTSEETLRAGEARIAEIGKELRRSGRIR